MRPQIVDILLCLRCRGTKLGLTVTKKDAVEILAGRVVCQNCGRSYPIEEGILNALIPGDHGVDSARQAYRVAKLSQPGSYKAQQLACREHLDPTYRRDTEANFQDLLARLQPGQGWALDIGAGTCWTTAGLAGKGHRAVAIDISADNKLELGRHHFGPSVYFDRVLADVNRLPFRDNVFGLAFASAAMHHSNDLGRSFSEISRVVCQAGLLELINEPVRGLMEAFQRNAGRLAAEGGVIEKHYGLNTWLRTIKRSGFRGSVRFPASIRHRLRSGQFEASHKFRGLTGTASRLYATKGGRALCEGPLFFSAMLFLGLPLVYSGRRSGN